MAGRALESVSVAVLDRPGSGPVEAKVRCDVAALSSRHPMAGSLAEMAYALARELDEGAGLATAAVNRELRANLTELTRLGVDDDGDLDSELSSPSAGVPAEVRDAKVVGAGDVGAGGGSRRRVAGPSADAVAAPRRRRRSGG